MALTKADIQKAPYNRPTIIGYNRLEGLPTSADYRKSLRAEIHDALWMLTRQWQMGEFDAEDAGTLVKAKLLVEQEKMTHIDMDNKRVLPLEEPVSVPLEMLVEKEARTIDLAFRMETGKLFKQILVENNLQAHLPDFLALFKLQMLELAKKNSPEGKLVTSIRSHSSDSELFDAIKNRMLDGFSVFQALAKPGKVYETKIKSGLARAGAKAINDALKAGNDFLALINLFYGDDMQRANAAWKPESLEYQFNIQSDKRPAKATILQVKSYPGDRLDWYDFDLEQVDSKTQEVATHIFIPSPVTFPGMPKSRWWEMEENQINFGNVNVKTTDLPTLILIDFALIYGNDWLIIPFPMEINKLCTIRGFIVTDVFGFHTYIPPIDTGSDVSWEKWSLFSQTDNSGTRTQPSFYLAPTLLKPLEQDPVERVSFLRDEISNMAWAFENVIQGSLGKGLRGAEVAEKEEEEVSSTEGQTLKYLLGTQVPFYQVPFIPVEIPFDATHSQIRLQRATMPNGPKPRGVFLTEISSPYYIREENISRAGTTVIRRWQRARWINGTVAQWIGREKQAGKSEGGTILLFDILV